MMLKKLFILSGLMGIAFLYQNFSQNNTIFVTYPDAKHGLVRTLINGNSFFHSETTTYDINKSTKYALFIVSVPQRGYYSIKANVIGPSGEENSFFVKANNNAPFVWDFSVCASTCGRLVKNSLRLESGDNYIYFFAREKNAKIADIWAEPVVPIFQENFKIRPSQMPQTPSLKIIPPGILQATYVPTVEGSARLLWRHDLAPSDEYTLSYKVRFGPNFDFAKGGKLHGIGPQSPATGCTPPTPEGWSARVMFSGDGHPFIYAYQQNRRTNCGQGFSSGNFKFEKNKWYWVSLYVKLNSTPTTADGIAKLYIDGVLHAQVSNLVLRGEISNRSSIQKFLFSTFHGGSSPEYSPQITENAYFDDFEIYPGDTPKPW